MGLLSSLQKDQILSLKDQNILNRNLVDTGKKLKMCQKMKEPRTVNDKKDFATENDL